MSETTAAGRHTKLFSRQPESTLPDHVRIALGLALHSYCVIDGFLGEERSRALLLEVQDYRLRGLFHSGRTVQADSQQPPLRTDEIVNLTGEEPECELLPHYLREADVLMAQVGAWFRESARLPVDLQGARSKAMCSVYRGERRAKYSVHYDNPNGNGRAITTILYLNFDWQEADGGVVRLFTESGAVDVAPLGDRLLCFWSDTRCPHEVLPAAVDRYAITLWYLDETERLLAEARQNQGDATQSDVLPQLALRLERLRDLGPNAPPELLRADTQAQQAVVASLRRENLVLRQKLQWRQRT